MLLFHHSLMFDPVNQVVPVCHQEQEFNSAFCCILDGLFESAILFIFYTTLFGGLQLYMATLGNCFEIDEWGPIEFSIHFGHISDTPLPRAARWNRLNVGCIVGSMHQHN
ncbi:hypothetical protein ZEAMMB73_Zm00001d017108 [Zea mays]|uniref:Uncharacterized protein n=1 Tax=Zea mays TaxID=4577 RepID=A0A1D6HCA5_MAIZE|nr:hypothetical protein ZEAMMB73_Zm00001d017108 [Zea mays]